MKFENLLKPIKIRNMELRNRVVFPAMATKLIADGGYVTDQLIDYHAARALGGNGLNITEAASVHTPSAPRNFLCISEDEFLPGLKKFTDAIHEAGGKACVQLWQGGIVAASNGPEVMCIVPSDFQTEEGVVPGASLDTIKEVVKAFGDAARRAAEAGFDCVEFHAAHNYSPHSFLSAAFNKRTDDYGGSLENRARYSLECIEAIRQNIPEDMPLFMRIDAQDDYLEDGLTIVDIIAFCKMAGKAGVDVLDVSRGNVVSAAMKFEVPPIDLPRGFNVENAARIKKETGMITIAVGRINDPQQAEKIIAEQKADMVVIGRGQIADPEFCNKAAAGEEEDIIRCIACNQGCVDKYMSPDAIHLSCMRNPAVGREKEYVLTKTESPKKVLVVGGGMAGIEAAILLQQRGHHPVLCEESNQLGGQFLLAGAAPRKGEMRDAAISRGKQAEKAGVDIRMSTPITSGLIAEINPDVIVIATGAEPITLNIPGIDLPIVAGFTEVLLGKTEPKGDVIVIGGGLVGLEAAEVIAEKGGKVTVIEMLDEVGKDLGSFRKVCVLENLQSAQINTMVNTKCMEIKEHSLLVEKDGKTEELPCDRVVMAIGSKPRAYEEIKAVCEEKGLPYHVIGDAAQARRAIDAIAEAHEIARKI